MEGWPVHPHGGWRSLRPGHILRRDENQGTSDLDPGRAWRGRGDCDPSCQLNRRPRRSRRRVRSARPALSSRAPALRSPADAPSLPDQRMWNQNISQAPVDPRSAQIMNGIKGGALHPDFGSPSKYGIPYIVVGADTKRGQDQVQDQERIRQRQVQDPAQRADRGRQERQGRPPRHRLRQRRLQAL